MAQFLTDTQINSVYELYIGYFNRAPEAGGLNYWSNYYLAQANAGKTDAAIQKEIANKFYDAAVQYNIYTAGTPVADFVKTSYLNALGRTSVDDAGMTYWTAKLTSGEVSRGEFVQKLISDAKGFASDATYGWVSKYLDNRMAVAKAFAAANTTTGDAAITAGKAALSAVTPAAVQAGQTPAQALAAAGFGDTSVAGNTFTLTNATDTATANVFNAGLVYVPGGNDRINALQDEDVLTGTGTKPTLNATLGNANDNGGTVVTPKLSGIETINVGFTGSGAAAANQLDLQDSANTGKEINITRISDGIATATIDNISVASEKLSVSNSGQPGQNVGFLFKNAALNGAADATTLTIKDVQLGNLRVESRTPTAGIGFETINLVSSSDANTVGQFFAEDLETLNISGDANLTLGATGNVVNAGIVEATTLGAGLGNVQGSLKTVNAAELTGNLDITFNGEFNAGRDGTSGQNTALSVTGGKGNDTFRLNADTINTTDVVDGGEGTNTLVMTNGSVVNAAGTATAPVANVKKVQNLEVRAGHDNNVVADATVVNADAFDSLAAIYVRNEGQNLGASAAEVMTVTLNNLTAAQGTAITVAHGTTGNNTILNNVVNANLKTSTGTAETVGITLVDGTNADLRFNLQLSTNADVVTTAAVERVENISVTDNDTESNTVQLVNSAQNTGTITLKGGATGQYLNLDADGSNANGLSGYALVETGALGSGAQNAAGTAIATADTAVNAVISTVDYRVLNNGANADVRLIAENVNAADYVGDVIVRLGDVTRTDGISSMSVTGGAGNDTFIFDAQGVKNSGYTSGDTVKAGAGTDTLVIDGNTVPGVGGNVSVQKSEWDNTTGVDVLRLAGNQGVANGLAANVIAAGIVASNTNVGGYYIEIDNEFVKQTDAGNNLKIVSNDGDLATNLESDLVLNLRPLTQTSNVTFVGANSNLAAVGVNASNRLQVEDNSANGVNVLDGGDSVTDEAGTAATRVSSGNNNVLEVFNTADVSINDLSNTKNFGRIEGTNDLAVAQTLKLVLNDTVVDQLVDAGTAARATAVGAVPANVERLVVVANNNANVAGAVENLNIDASAVTNKFGLDVIADRGTTNTIVGTAGTDKVVLKGNFTAAEQVADGHAAVTLFAGANALTGTALTTAIAANGTAYKGVDGVAGTADDVLLAYTGTYTNIETIETFGGVDLTGATISAGTTIVAHSAVRLTAEQFNALTSITFVGGGAHGLQIVNNTTTNAEVAPNLSKVTLSGAGTTVTYTTGTEVPAATGTATLSSGATTQPTNGGTTTGTNGGTSTGGTTTTANFTLTAGIDQFNATTGTVNSVGTLTNVYGGTTGATLTANTAYTLASTIANITSLDTLAFGTATTDTLSISDSGSFTINTASVNGANVTGLDVLQLGSTGANNITLTALTNTGLVIKGGTSQDIIGVAANLVSNIQTGAGGDQITYAAFTGTSTASLDAGDGDDTIVFAGGTVATTASQGFTTVIGGGGTDTISIANADSTSVVDADFQKVSSVEVLKLLNAGTNSGAATLDGLAYLAGVRKVIVGASSDSGDNVVTTGSTYALLQGTGVLTVDAGALADGSDVKIGNSSAGNISITNLLNGDVIMGTGVTANITVTSTNVTNTVAQSITTLGGNDVVVAGAGADIINVGNGTNSVTGAGKADAITLGTGTDKVIYTSATGTALLAEAGSAVGAAATTAPVLTTSDAITSFTAGTDKIVLSVALGTAGAAGGLVATGGTSYTTAATALVAADFIDNTVVLGTSAASAITANTAGGGRILLVNDGTHGYLIYDQSGDSAINTSGAYTAGAADDFVLVKLVSVTAVTASDFIFA